jgi:predicted ATPase
MITRIEALGYRCLRYVSQPLEPFHVLVGPNASGKTTFLDVLSFLGRLVSEGVDAAVEERTQNFYDLVWRQEGTKFELAVEARIPQVLREQLLEKEFDTVRYEISVGIDPVSRNLGIQAESLLLKSASSRSARPRPTFPRVDQIPTELKNETRQSYILFKPQNGTAKLYSEACSMDPQEWPREVKSGPRRSSLGKLPEDDLKCFPVGLWLRETLTSGVQQLLLNGAVLRKASPPGQGLRLRPDGANLPWIVGDLRSRSPELFRQWIAHLQTAFPDLQDIKAIERPEDRHRYLVLNYGEGLEVPSWMASDGTLRMLALTLPAYLEGFKGIYLIEEPENGIHPRAIETMTQSLSSVYDAQVLLATHSPVILSTVEAEQILCFAKTPEGATDIVRGSEHPALKSWKHETTLGTLFAAGVLG